MRHALPALVASSLLAATGCLDPLPPLPDVAPGSGKDGGTVGAGDGGVVGLEDGGGRDVTGPIDDGGTPDGGNNPGNDGGNDPGGDGGNNPGGDGGNNSGGDGGNNPGGDGGNNPGGDGGNNPGDEDAGPCTPVAPVPDLSFSGDGIFDEGCGTQWGAFRDVVVLPDGSLLAAGDDGRAIVRKLGPDGQPATFVGGSSCIAYTGPQPDGGVVIPGETFQSVSGQAVAVDGAGKILFAIHRIAPDNNGNCAYSVLVRRYDSGGFEDTSFGTNGEVTVPAGSTYCEMGGGSPPDTDIAVDAAGHIYVATSLVEDLSTSLSTPHIGVISPSGEVATWTDQGSFGSAVGVVIDEDDGSAIVVGTRGQGNNRQATLWRVRPSGSAAEPTVTPLTNVAPGQDYSTGLGVALDDQRRILLAGEAMTNTADRFALVARSASDGSRDADFGISGFALTNLGTDYIEEARGVVDDGARVWLTAKRGSNGSLLLRRLRNGEADCFVQAESPPTAGGFAIEGARTLPLAEVYGIDTWDNGVVVVGRAQSNNRAAVVRIRN